MKQLTKGILPLFVLSEAEAAPTSGKKVAETIQKLTCGNWRPSPGSLYPILRRMEETGMLKCRLEHGSGRREILYEITKKGHGGLNEGRKGLVEAANRRFKTVMPLALRISMGAGGMRLEEGISEMASSICEIRNLLMSFPVAKRQEAMKRIASKYRRMVAELRERA